MSYSIAPRIFALGLFGAIAALASPLSAQMRTWTGDDKVTTFKAELTDAYADTAYFCLENGKSFQIPVSRLAPYDIARIVEWAEERDAQQQPVLMMSQGQVAKDICKAWPNRITPEKVDDKIDVNNIVQPRIFIFTMIRNTVASGDLTNVIDDLSEKLNSIRDSEAKMNGENGHFADGIVIVGMDGDSTHVQLIDMIRRHGGSWLLPNRWANKEQKAIWNAYWRPNETAILLIDPATGTILCDNSRKNPATGTNEDPVAFMKQMEGVAERMRNGGCSVDNPLLNDEALKKIIAQKIADKTTSGPAPLAFDFSGIDPETFQTLEGKNFVVSMEIGADGHVRNLTLDKGDPSAEKALKQASVLWAFSPVFKDGVPVAKMIKAPIHIKAPTPPANAPKAQ